MKRIKWTYCSEVNLGTEEEPNIKQTFIPKDFHYSEEAEKAAKREAGDNYEIYDDGISSCPVVNHNVVAGEYVTIDNKLYKATENIPNGERIIVGQNAVATTVEEQLYELMNKED